MGILLGMSGSIYLWLAIAVLVFWCVGVYNRLMRLRARGFAAFGALEKQLKTFQAPVQLYAADPEGKSSSYASSDLLSGPWAVLQEKVQALERAHNGVRASPLQSQPLAEMATAMDAVLREWQGISSEPADLAGSPVPDAMRLQWDDASLRAQAARSAFNQIVLRYNESLQEFPAHLIVGILGFKPMGSL